MERDGDDRIVKAGDGTGGPSFEASPCSSASIGAASGCPDWLVSSAGKTSGVSGTTPLTEGCCCVAVGSRCGCSPDRITCTRTSRVCLSLWGRLPTGSRRGGTGGRHSPGSTLLRFTVKSASNGSVRSSALVGLVAPCTLSQCVRRLC